MASPPNFNRTTNMSMAYGAPVNYGTWPKEIGMPGYAGPIQPFVPLTGLFPPKDMPKWPPGLTQPTELRSAAYDPAKEPVPSYVPPTKIALAPRGMSVDPSTPSPLPALAPIVPPSPTTPPPSGLPRMEAIPLRSL